MSEASDASDVLASLEAIEPADVDDLSDELVAASGDDEQLALRLGVLPGDVIEKRRFYDANELGRLCDLARADVLIRFAKDLRAADGEGQWERTDAGLRHVKRDLAWAANEAIRLASDLSGEPLEGKTNEQLINEEAS